MSNSENNVYVQRSLGKKSGEVYRYLDDAITSGEFPARGQLPTEVALARRFQASRPTIARAIQRLVAEGKVQRRRGAGTFVQPWRSAASGSPGGESNRRILGLLAPYLMPLDHGSRPASVFLGASRALAKAAEARGYGFLLGNVHDASNEDGIIERMTHSVDDLIQGNLAGLFIVPPEVSPANAQIPGALVQKVYQAGIPVVLIDSDVVPFPGRSNQIDSVGMDNLYAGGTVARHLIEQGRQRLLFVAGQSHSSALEERIIGARAAVEQAPPSAACAWLPVFRGDPFAPNQIRDLLRRRKPDALICAHDWMASAVLRTLIAMGIRIPDDLAVTGFDDIDYGPKFTPIPLTTFRWPADGIADEAVRLMERRQLHNDLHAVHAMILPTFIPRASSERPATRPQAAPLAPRAATRTKRAAVTATAR